MLLNERNQKSNIFTAAIEVKDEFGSFLVLFIHRYSRTIHRLAYKKNAQLVLRLA